MDEKARLAERLAAALGSKPGTTQREIADRVGVTAQAVSRWLKTGEVSDENLRKVAEILGVDYGWLRFGERQESGVEVALSGLPVQQRVLFLNLLELLAPRSPPVRDIRAAALQWAEILMQDGGGVLQVVVWEPDGKVVSASPAAAEYLGARPGVVLKEMSIPPALGEAISANLRQAADSKHPGSVCLRVLGRILHYRFIPAPAGEGEIAMVAMVGEDLTDKLRGAGVPT